MLKLVCGKCQIELKPEHNGVVVAEMFQKNTVIYRMWHADLYKCGKCGNEVVTGFADRPFAQHFDGNCDEMLSKLKKGNSRIIFDYEITGNNKKRRLK